MITLLSHTRDSFAEAVFAALGRGKQHAAQFYSDWLQGRAIGVHPMFANAQQLLAEMQQLTDQTLLPISGERGSGEARKLWLRTPDGYEVESVVLPMRNGWSLCVSSQVGCRMGCVFCETGRMGLKRNLTVAEIVSQVFVAKHELGVPVRNIVFMGMGEPFDNYEAVAQSVRVLSDPGGLGLARQRITLSTSGRVDGIYRLIADDLGVNLAVSVNASNEATRSKLMPVNKQYSMPELWQAMQAYCTATGREIFVEYVLIHGRNDTLENADELAAYLRGLSVKVNVIPYNPQSRYALTAPSRIAVDSFANRLRTHGYRTLVRQTKGQEIMAACGQLGKKISAQGVTERHLR